jgi:hypothetical protein
MSVLQGLISNGGNLYAAWKGEPNDDRIFYSHRNGSGTWSAASPMASATVGGNTSAGPSLGIFNGSVYAAWKGEWSDPRLFWARYNGTNWENQQQIPHAYSDEGPALCAYSSTKLIAAWKNFDQTLYYAIYDSSNSKWSEPATIPGTASSVGPSLAALGGKIYAAWKGEDSDQSLWYSYYDGSWHPQTKIAGVGSSVGPSLATVGSKLYAVWKGESSDQNLYYTYYDGSWHPQTKISGATSSIGAAIAELGGNLYAIAKGKDTDVGLYTSELTSNGWLDWKSDIPGNTGPDPLTPLATPGGGPNNYAFSDSKGKNAALTGTTVTMTVVEDIVPENSKNYSLQINCYGKPPQAASANPFYWQQYGFRMAANQLFFWVNDFRPQDLPAAYYLGWDSRAMPNNTGVTSLPNNVLPKDWQLTTALTTDHGGNVTGFSFNVIRADGSVALNSGPMALQTLPGLKVSVAPDNLAPIINFQVILVAENPASNNPGDTVTFSSGKGIFLSRADNALAAATPSLPVSEEVSNVRYSALPASYPNGEFFQFFGAPSV